VEVATPAAAGVVQVAQVLIPLAATQVVTVAWDTLVASLVLLVSMQVAVVAGESTAAQMEQVAVASEATVLRPELLEQ
jgi:hypothetical protein